MQASDGYQNKQWWDNLKHEKQAGNQYRKIDNHPAENVSWFDAMACCRWLTDKLGCEIRLPTEWEWQQGATEGKPVNVYPWGEDFDSRYCNSIESGLGRTTAVGLYINGKSPVGALDMSGNVLEWCSNTDYLPGHSDVDLTSSRVMRGGSWVNLQGVARAAYRLYDVPDYRNYDLGFRVVSSSPIIE